MKPTSPNKKAQFISPSQLQEVNDLLNSLPPDLQQKLKNGDFDSALAKIGSLMGVPDSRSSNIIQGNFSNAGSKEIQDPVGNEHYHMQIVIQGITGLNRELSIPTDATFYHLHMAIQDLFNWEGDHLFAFTVGGRNDAINIGANESQHLLPVRLFDILGKKTKKFSYLYDFGDSWNHLITIKKVEKLEKPNPHPVAISGKGVPPPEDCGGVYGYEGLKAGDHWWYEDDPEYWKEYFEREFLPQTVVFSDAKRCFKSTQGKPHGF